MVAVMEPRRMSKKRNVSRPEPERGERKVPAELRFGERTVNELDDTIRTIRLLLKNLEGSVDGARKMEIDSLRLDGVTKGDRAIQLLKDYAANVEHAFKKEVYGRL